jgi:hypothetical protein
MGIKKTTAVNLRSNAIPDVAYTIFKFVSRDYFERRISENVQIGKKQQVRHKLVLCNVMEVHRSYKDILLKVK